jgi:lysophospholipase L1-like esterase
MLLFYGLSWFLSTILIYTGILILILYILRVVERKVQSGVRLKLRFKHVKYYLIVFFTFIILVDLGLRIFVPMLKSYSEKNYGWYYKAYFSEAEKYFRNVDDVNHLYPPDSQHIYECEDFIYTHFYNEFGIRDRYNLVDLTKDKIVILTVGDSFVEGVGTHQDSTWQRFLEQSLNDNVNDFIVINAGIAGSDPVHAVNLLDDLISDFAPNYVLLCIGSNDFMDIAQRGGFDNYKKRNEFVQVQDFENYFYSWSFIYRLVIKVFYAHPETFMTKKEYKRKMEESSDIINTAVEELELKSKEHDFIPIVLFYPDYTESKNLYYNISEVDSFIQTTKNKSIIHVIEILDFHKQNRGLHGINKSDLYWINDGHNTIKGYKLWSDIVSDDLKKNLNCL